MRNEPYICIISRELKIIALPYAVSSDEIESQEPADTAKKSFEKDTRDIGKAANYIQQSETCREFCFILSNQAARRVFS